ncbi:uncharacterized protein LOC117183094 [Belonocnema kinseyi]|uniref:uncharacterized protein LOC117183094 n=1 Tax=Belonocnema kinseyi TaxID=2817044 RepID=UPI00143D599B|nr:uncharacterized protein LOC117183094 [Belonocnema kinseyi]
MEQLKVKCDSKDKSLFPNILADQENAGSVRAQLIHELVKKAHDIRAKEEITNYDWDKWDKWTEEICISNKTLKEISINAIDNVQQCVDQNDQLNDEEKSKIQANLFKSFCDKVKVSAEWSYRSSHVENP